MWVFSGFFWRQGLCVTVLSFLQDRVINLVVGGLTSLLLVVSISHPVPRFMPPLGDRVKIGVPPQNGAELH